MIETAGNFRLRNGHGSGMTRLVWKSSPPNGDTLRFGNTSAGFLGSVRGARGSETPLPALSCQVWKWEVSVGPMLSRIRKWMGYPLGQGRVEAAAALLDKAKWNAAVLAMAWI